MGVIEIIGVDPEYQRRGIGSRLTEVAIDHMRREGMDIAVVETGGDPGHAPCASSVRRGGVHASTDQPVLPTPPLTFVRVTFLNAGPGEAPCSAYGIIGADDRQRVGLDAQGL
jgi:GNAT superfamily N-acetyltransferase